MKLKLEKTKLADDYGRPILFYHTTNVAKEIKQFYPLTHFGTYQAAKMRGIHLAYKALGFIEPLEPQEELPKNLQQKLNTKHPNYLKRYQVYLHIKKPLEICDFGEHSLKMYHQRFSSFYSPKSIYLTPKECLERDTVGPEKMSYKKALTEFIFVNPFIQTTENLQKELAAEHLFPFTSKDPKKLAEKVAYQRMIRYLESEGHDSFVYNNDCEDRGKKSYIIFRPEQVFRTGEREHDVPSISKENQAFLNKIEVDFFEQKGFIPPYKRRELNRQIRAKSLNRFTK